MSKKFKISFKSIVGIGAFYKIYCESHGDINKAKHVEFDLDQVDWMPLFPMALLCSWAKMLSTQYKDVFIRIGSSLERNSMHKILIGGGIIEYLNALGIQHDCLKYRPRRANDLIPLHSLSKTWFDDYKFSQKNLWETNQEFIQSFRGAAPKLAREVFAVLVKELAENAYFHGAGACPYIGLYQAESSPQASQSEAITAYPPGVKYVEIAIGDSGPGIPEMLKAEKGWVPPFNIEQHGRHKPAPLTQDELSIPYAFEFASTSNKTGRQNRISELISGDSEVDPSFIGTGLYHVLSLAKEHRANFIVLSSRGIIHCDCSSGKITCRPLYKNSSPKRLSFQGTHYLFRFPLNFKPLENEPQENLKTGLTVNEFVATAVFQRRSSVDTEANVIDNSINSLIKGVSDCERSNKTDVALCIYPNAAPLSTRAVEVFLRLVYDRLSENLNIFWLSDASLIISAIKGILQHPQTQSHRLFNPFPLWVGQTHSPYFKRLAINNDVLSEENVILSLAQQTQLAATVKQFIQELIVNRVEQPDVKLSPGPFIFPGGYYSSEFYQLAVALNEDSFRNYVADWLIFDNSAQPDLIVAQCDAMEHVASTVARRCTEKGWSYPLILPLKGDEDFSKIHVAAFFARQSLGVEKESLNIWILTDVVLRAKRINQCILAVQKAFPTKAKISVATIIDARENIQNILAIGNVTIPFTSIYTSPIPTNSDLTHLPTQGADKTYTEELWSVDFRTNRPIKRKRQRGAHLDMDDLLQEKGQEFLRSGHIEDGEKHFSYWVDMPQFLNIYKDAIVDWLQNLLAFVPEKRNLPTDCVVINERKLPGIYDILKCVAPSLRSIQSLEKIESKLSTSKPLSGTDKNAKTRFLLIIPVMASGSIMMKALDTISGISASEIIVAALCSRVKSDRFKFFSEVQLYHNRHLEIHAFTRFLVPAFRADAILCPICNLSNVYQTICSSKLKTSHPRLSALLEKTIGSLATQQTLSSDYGADAQDVRSAQMRHLFILAEVDITAKLKLLERLKERENVTALCKNLIIDLRSKTRALNMRAIVPSLNQYVNTAIESVIADKDSSALDVIPLIEYLLACEEENAKVIILKLLQNDKFQASVAEKLILASLIGPRVPFSPKTLMGLADATNGDTKVLLHDASNYLNEKLLPAAPMAINTVREILEQIERSSELRTAIRRTLQAVVIGPIKSKGEMSRYSEIDHSLLALKETFRTSLLHRIHRLKGTKLWEKINTPMAESAVHGLLPEELLDSINDLINTLVNKGRNEILELELQSKVESIRNMLDCISRHIRLLFPNPIWVFKKMLDPSGVSFQLGENIELIVDLNESELRPVLFPAPELEKVIFEVMKNIKAASEQVASGRVKIEARVIIDKSIMKLSFYDNLPGKMTMRKAGGGLLLIHETSDSFGAAVDISNESTIDGFSKELTITMQIEERLFNESQR